MYLLNPNPGTVSQGVVNYSFGETLKPKNPHSANSQKGSNTCTESGLIPCLLEALNEAFNSQLL